MPSPASPPGPAALSPPGSPADLARSRGAAFALLARLLGPDTAGLAADDTRHALRDLLRQLGEDHAVGLLDGRGDPMPDPGELTARWVRWFDQGRIAPYEGSNVASTAGGVTPLLADVAGFYRAFGMNVSGDRPDHVVAELEFVALLLVGEAEAIDHDDPDHAAVCGEAVRTFLRDHLGTWLDGWAARLDGTAETTPWAPVAAAAAALVQSEARRRNVVPVRSGAVLGADGGVPADGDLDLECGDDGLEGPG